MSLPDLEKTFELLDTQNREQFVEIFMRKAIKKIGNKLEVYTL